MITDQEIYAWTPEVGDRIEVVFSDRHIHCRGVLVAKQGDTRFLHCDGYQARYPSPHWSPEWTVSFRADQVRRETTAADHLEIALSLLEKPKFGWFTSKAQKERHEVTQKAIYAMVGHLRAQTPPVNVADQIMEVTEDGIRRGDRVNIAVLEGGGKGVFAGTFVAEYKDRRHVLYDNGAPAAYPIAQVTAAK